MTSAVVDQPKAGDLATQSTVLELVWPLTLLIAFLALFAAWYARLLDFNIAAAAWFCAGGIGGSMLISALTEVPQLRPYRALAYASIHPVGLFVLAALWVNCSAGAQPAFMLFFAPPLLAGAFLPSLWQRFAMYVGTVSAIGLAMAVCSPSLRWYLSQSGLPVDWLELLSNRLAPATQATVSESPLHALLILLWGVAALTAVSIIGGAFARRAEMRHRALRETITSRQQQDLLLQTMVHESGLSEALVMPETGRIVLSSQRFDQRFFDGKAAAEQPLLAVLRPTQPEGLLAVVRGTSPRCESTLQRPDGGAIAAHIEAIDFRRVGVALLRIVVTESTLTEHFVAAFDAVKESVVLIDAADQVLHANAGARALFAPCEAGIRAQVALRQADLPVGWWRVAEGAAMPRELRIAGQTHRGYVSCRRSRMNLDPTTVVVIG
jgi:hypothetical protein